MSIVGLGTDIVAVGRMADLLSRHGDRFLNRCFAPAEKLDLSGRHATARAMAVAGRWAAKEAFLKALGGEISHIPYHEIRVRNVAGGAPLLTVTGVAAQGLAACGGHRVHLSLSHERDYAVATVLIED